MWKDKGKMFRKNTQKKWNDQKEEKWAYFKNTEMKNSIQTLISDYFY